MGQRRTGHLLKGIDKMKTQRLMTLLAVTLSLSFFVSGQEAKHKKLIGFDHSTPTPLFLKKNIAEMEKRAPYDGIGIRVATSGKVNGKTINCSGWTVCSNIPWKYEWFADTVKTLQEIKFKKFKHNFLRTTVHPGTLSLFSDTDWAAAGNNFSILSKIAKEGGLKGLFFDIEDYANSLFAYKKERYPGKSLEDVKKMMRKRGQEIGNAVFRAYPDIVLFCPFGPSINRIIAEAPNLETKDAWANTYVLFPAFFNGLLDVLPATAVIVDGHEGRGYYAEFKLIRKIHNQLSPRLVQPENMEKYKNQVQLGIGLYLDPYFYPEAMKKTSQFFRALAPENKDRLSVFRHNLDQSFATSEEYVWTWGEGAAWWKEAAPGKKMPLWEDFCPGVTAATEEIRSKY